MHVTRPIASVRGSLWRLTSGTLRRRSLVKPILLPNVCGSETRVPPISLRNTPRKSPVRAALCNARAASRVSYCRLCTARARLWRAYFGRCTAFFDFCAGNCRLRSAKASRRNAKARFWRKKDPPLRAKDGIWPARDAIGSDRDRPGAAQILPAAAKNPPLACGDPPAGGKDCPAARRKWTCLGTHDPRDLPP